MLLRCATREVSAMLALPSSLHLTGIIFTYFVRNGAHGHLNKPELSAVAAVEVCGMPLRCGTGEVS